MKIHIKDSDVDLRAVSTVKVNCGKEINFSEPIEAPWNDGRTCQECLRIHQNGEHKKFTFAFTEQTPED